MKIILILAQTVFIVVFSPFVAGFIRKIKNNIRMRVGAGMFQPYYNFAKLFGKDEAVSENASWVFKVTPFIVLASSIASATLVPVFRSWLSLNYMGDFIALIFIISLGRFFLSLAGLDTASAFAGMGSSREMFISGLAEPIALLSIFAISFNCGSTSLQLISASAFFKFSTFLAAVSLFIVIIAETSRLPIDNQETHLELTMVHEAMALEYSGRSLALLEMAAYIKQVVFFSLIIAFLFPSGSVLTYFIRLIFICIGVAVLEVSLAKMRLFRVVDLLTFSIVISLLAVVTQALGF